MGAYSCVCARRPVDGGRRGRSIDLEGEPWHYWSWRTCTSRSRTAPRSSRASTSTVDTNEVHAIMGPNGSGKSTLSYAIAGHPAYEVTEGRILLDGDDITGAGADERAQPGLFLAFQYPQAIPGVRVTEFLRTAINAIRKAKAGSDDPMPVREFREELFAQMDRLKVSRELASRYLNDGFSGGEKKRVEILQMAMLKPRIAVLDETDSGLDIDALKVVADGVQRARRPGHGRARHHALQADPQLHQAGPRPRLRRREDRRVRRPRAGR